MTNAGKDIFRRFKYEIIANAACVTRHHIIDQSIEQFLASDPDGTIIVLGAGFDTRAFRHKGGNWFELDEYQLIDFKNRQLPISECPNALQRISIDFSTNELDQRLHSISHNGSIMVIIEGVFMYLDTTQISSLLDTLRKHFPRHDLVCDLLTKRFQQLFGLSIQRKIKAMGNRFTTTTSPEKLFAAADYRPLTYTSIVARTLKLHALPLPAMLANFLPGIVEKGYGIYHFSYGKNQAS
jgi:O-methyltransferase involved in polyketide biosynthesis